jgi:hypothetical protein
LLYQKSLPTRRWKFFIEHLQNDLPIPVDYKPGRGSGERNAAVLKNDLCFPLSKVEQQIFVVHRRWRYSPTVRLN